MFERFTDGARRTVVVAQEHARRTNAGAIGTEHLLLAVARVDGTAQVALAAAGLATDRIDAAVAAVATTEPSTVGGPLPFSVNCKDALELAMREAVQLGHTTVDTGHILLGLLEVPDGRALAALQHLDVDTASLRRLTVDVLRGVEPPGGPTGPAATATATRPSSVVFETTGPLAASTTGPGLRCSFCGRDLAGVHHIAAAGSRICADCLRAGNRLVEDAVERGDEPGALHLPPRLAGSPPGDQQALAAVVEAFTVVFDNARPDHERADRLEDGDALAPLLTRAHARYPGAGGAVVEAVRFVDDTYAEVRFSILYGNAAIAQEGSARRVDGQWKVTRMTFCQLMARAGFPCPPWPDA